ncbi:MAG: signal peptidase I [Lachnospiraceae bacterium]|jgi:signal peptidase I|nr:signal peptidase I [Lachnospiraceae bacterium]MBO4824490.1 signal peptidase I [Lachnospiraceae bacterium]MBR5761462.1 signal peptidase I [Lachnospiraceae bacterium]MBR5897034.1 signal peptidase I [Lachnospiraceae bacterium]MBR5994506.1 signal peptidase I [Lachnospiraceae bacterium]
MRRRHKGLDFNHRRRKKINAGVLKEIFSWIFWIGISAVTAVVLVVVFGLRTNVVGNSMEPHLYAGQEILINRLIYQISEPKFGDVIAFQPNGNENAHYYVKRVIGVPGDTIVIRNGRVYIDDVELKEDDSYDKIADPGIAESEIFLKEGEYFVLGDNRNFSEDSRSGNIGIVKHDYIIGKVWFKLSDKLDYIGIVK